MPRKQDSSEDGESVPIFSADCKTTQILLNEANGATYPKTLLQL